MTFYVLAVPNGVDSSVPFGVEELPLSCMYGHNS